jgi:hypothetical protein
LTVGDASSDTLTVNASSTFNATLSTAGAIIVSARDGTPKISIRETFATSATERFGTLEWIENQTTTAKYQIYHWSHNSTVTPDQVSHYHNNGSTGVYTYDLLADHTHNFRTAVTLATLAGTGTRITTSSSTGLQGTRLASSYIIQTLTANAAIALDTELLRMTGTGFTGTLTTSLGNSRLVSFLNSGTGNLIIACNGAETINGVATLVIPVGGLAKICSTAAGIWETVL